MPAWNAVDYPALVRKFAHIVGVNMEWKGTTLELGKKLGVRRQTAYNILKVLRAAGVLETKGKGINGITIKLTASPEEIAQKMAEKGLTWKIDKTKKSVKPKLPLIDSGQQIEPESPFAVLRALKYDEQAALVEAARQYGQRMEFIQEKQAEFARHGLTLNMEALGLQTDERLGQIAVVVPYIDRLERTNGRLQDQVNKGASVPTAKVDSLEAENQRLRRELESAITERAQQREAVAELQQAHRNEMSVLKGQLTVAQEQMMILRRQAVERVNSDDHQPVVAGL